MRADTVGCLLVPQCQLAQYIDMLWLPAHCPRLIQAELSQSTMMQLLPRQSYSSCHTLTQLDRIVFVHVVVLAVLPVV